MCRLRPLIFSAASKPRGRRPRLLDRLAVDDDRRRHCLAALRLARPHHEYADDLRKAASSETDDARLRRSIFPRPYI